jgi:hypothetical protein
MPLFLTDFRDLYYAKVYRSTAQSIANNFEDIVGYDIIATDPNGNFTTGAAAKYTAPVAGAYLVTAVLSWTQAISSTYIKVYVNGSANQIGPQPAPGSPTYVVDYAGILRLAKGDYVQISPFQSSGGAVNTNSGIEFMPFAINYMSPL